MKKRVLKFTGFITILLVSIVTLFLVMYKLQLYLPGQLVNGRDVHGMSHVDALNMFYTEMPDEFILVNDTTEINLTCDFIKKVDFDTFKHSNFMDWLKRVPLQRECYYVDIVALREQLADNILEPHNAEITLIDYDYVLLREDAGFVYDEALIVDKIINALLAGEVNLDVTDVCVQPDVKASDLQEAYSNVEWLNDFNIEYNSGLVIDNSILNTYVSENKLELTDEFFTELFKDLSAYYDTTDNTLTFRTTKGKDVLVDYATYGVYLNEDKEREELTEIFENRKSVYRKPALKGYDNLSDTYIEISITDQHLWYYVDGELLMETDIVTGTKGENDTPHGLYFISECIDGKYLRGEDYVTWVDKWMRITNRGHGLHDASWRSSFGGRIYTYNGSHGCINLPKKFAYELFEAVNVGLPVIIY